MIEFREKFYSEADAMRELYLKLQERQRTRKPPILKGIIQLEDLPSVLRGNNVVIEKFVLVRSFLGKDKYRVFLKMGSKVKLPKTVALPSKSYDKSIGKVSLGYTDAKIGSPFYNQQQQQQQQQKQKLNSETEKESIVWGKLEERIYKDKGGGGGASIGGIRFEPSGMNLNYTKKEPLGDVVKYSQKDRSLVIESKSVDNILDSLNVLPFGLNYNIYLLDA